MINEDNEDESEISFQDNSQLKKELKHLKKEKIIYKKEIQKIKCENTKTKNELEKIKREKSKIEKELEHIKKENTKIKTEADKIGKDVLKTNQQIRNLKWELTYRANVEKIDKNSLIQSFYKILEKLKKESK